MTVTVARVMHLRRPVEAVAGGQALHGVAAGQKAACTCGAVSRDRSNE